MSDLRAEFEKEYLSAAELAGFTPDLRKYHDGAYIQSSVYWAYRTWLESRDARNTTDAGISHE